MKTYTTAIREVEEHTLESIQCDKCKNTYTDTFEIQEFFCIGQDVGYGGILGDGNRVRLDLCQHCFVSLFDGVYRIEGNYIWSGNE